MQLFIVVNFNTQVFSLRMILVGNSKTINKVLKSEKKLGVKNILYSIRDLEWDCFKDEAEIILCILGYEDPPDD